MVAALEAALWAGMGCSLTAGDREESVQLWAGQWGGAWSLPPHGDPSGPAVQQAVRASWTTLWSHTEWKDNGDTV